MLDESSINFQLFTWLPTIFHLYSKLENWNLCAFFKKLDQNVFSYFKIHWYFCFLWISQCHSWKSIKVALTFGIILQNIFKYKKGHYAFGFYWKSKYTLSFFAMIKHLWFYHKINIYGLTKPITTTDEVKKIPICIFGLSFQS